MLDRRVAGARRSRAVTASRSASSVRPSAERPPASSWTSRWYTSGTFGTAGSRASGSSRTRQSSARSWPPRLPQPHDAPAGAGGQMRPAGPPCRQGQRRPTAVRALRGPLSGQTAGPLADRPTVTGGRWCCTGSTCTCPGADRPPPASCAETLPVAHPLGRTPRTLAPRLDLHQARRSQHVQPPARRPSTGAWAATARRRPETGTHSYPRLRSSQPAAWSRENRAAQYVAFGFRCSCPTPGARALAP